MKSIFIVQDFEGNILGAYKYKMSAHKKALKEIGNSKSWISCSESHYNKTIVPSYQNTIDRLNKYKRVSIDSICKMITITEVELSK